MPTPQLVPVRVQKRNARRAALVLELKGLLARLDYEKLRIHIHTAKGVTTAYVAQPSLTPDMPKFHRGGPDGADKLGSTGIAQPS